MAYQAAAVAGTQLSITVGSPGVLTLIPGVHNYAETGGERKQIDVTAINDMIEKNIPGRAAIKTITFSIYEDSSNAVHAGLLASKQAAIPVTVPWTMVDPDVGAASHAFSAYVTQYLRKRDVQGPLVADIIALLTTDIITTP